VIVIPNSKVWGDVITNNSASETRRVDMVFGIGYKDPIDKAQAIMEKIVDNHPAVLSDPPPLIRVNQLSASSVDFICRPWVRSEDYLTAKLDITQAVKEAFDANGISIPYPQQDVHIITREA
jgi:small conductance mechanosensitive channel